MNAERWGRIGDLFDTAASLPPAERGEWLLRACDGDQGLRSEVENLLVHDRQADVDGFLDETAIWDRPESATGDWSTPVVSALHHEVHPLLAEATPETGTDGFSPRPALTSDRRSRLDEETRSVVQSRLRALTIIHILIFGMMILVRPLVLGTLVPLIVPFTILAVLLATVSILLMTRRFPLESLRKIDFGITLALAAILVYYEALAMTGTTSWEERLRSEKIMKNVVLLLSFLMLIDAIYVPKGWRQAAVLSTLLAMLPVGTLLGALLVKPLSVVWVAQFRADGIKPLAVLVLDTVFLLTLAGISTFAAHTISRLRSAVIEARRFGQYRLGERIGAGAMGEVFLAEHELLKRPCAVKLIRPEVVRHAGTVERFEREVRINAKLSHPNTVEIFDYGRTEDGTYYYVMEYLPGMSLAQLVERHGPLPPGRAVYLLRQVAQALGEAHEAGLIHRDIKPSNIFAARRGGMDDVAKLLDFGLVRPSASASSPSSSKSDEGQILGTPLYMSPEQATGARTLDARSDIYSLGAVAYFLVTGRPPFLEATPIEAIIAHARDPVVPPSERRPGLPSDLDAVIVRCLAKDPADRFFDAESLSVALGQCACVGDWNKELARHWWRG